MVFCFVDNEAAATTLGRSWTREAAKAFGIEINVVALPAKVRARVLAAQLKQHSATGQPPA